MDDDKLATKGSRGSKRTSHLKNAEQPEAAGAMMARPPIAQPLWGSGGPGGGREPALTRDR
eukprot:6613177-Pyramimonas_sp.AAC.1